MSGPILHRRYSRDEALALFAGAAETESLCDGQWVALPGAVLGFMDVGAPPLSAHFGPASGFHWVTAHPPIPYNPRRPHAARNAAVPAAVRGVGPSRRPVHLFARRPGESDYFYVGRLTWSHSFDRVIGTDWGQADFDLSPPLPARVWSELGGQRLGPDHAALDARLARLHGPATVRDRLDVVRHIVEHWHGAIRPGAGIPDAELPAVMPLPLRWWYNLAGRRQGLVDGSNHLFGPSGLRWGGDRMLFCHYADNEGDYFWLTLPCGDDPPVWVGRDREGPWDECGTLSEFLLAASILAIHTSGSAPYVADGRASEADMARLSRIAPPLPVPAWDWPFRSTTVQAGGGAFLAVVGFGAEVLGASYRVLAAARSEQPLGLLACALEGGWDYIHWPTPSLESAWVSANGGAAGKLIEAIRTEGRWGDLPVLADALEDAGCADAGLLDHLRRGPHAGPCRVLAPEPERNLGDLPF